MIVLKKKTVLHELAVCLFLMLEFDPDTTAASLVRRIRERAAQAVQTAAFYTGVIAEREVSEFLKAPPFKFTIHCHTDIVIGDTIRFMEDVFDNRTKPSRRVGKRGVTAEVTDMHLNGANTIVRLRVIVTGGAWDIKPETEIRRTLKKIVRQEVMRTAWPDEARRDTLRSRPVTHPETLKNAAIETFVRQSHHRSTFSKRGRHDD